MALSKTNTDAMCCDQSAGSPPLRGIRKFLYRFNLWTGLYMLEFHERLTILAVAGAFSAAAFLYMCVFARGFWEGWNEVAAEVVAEASLGDSLVEG
mmetsp:Transcript_18029/g.52232  ORF Transcript_18029/g.52232 Transcript_18029/m.52232 type:complete len:96 (-) Transcript_18029:689-976(-)|eukprot:CAMPEP_0113557876 /NCGR_PEP_ID=MMETSP0015_2-20120614/18036_1 /TAXON_ID=2838 /ORGANISM="Odontella" /LENGTH=95 /DNA_ID=CAMNT_0000459353 /DNA_START=161 /DNA_END=448 /DNA_ORIENTATION=- /assembly_acc=CAM_ASM_000160